MPYLTPDAPSGNTGRILIIPDTYVPSVNGALFELCELYNWEMHGDQTPQDAVDAMWAMIEEYYLSGLVNGRDVEINVWNPAGTDTTWLWQSTPTQYPGGWFRMPNAVAVGRWVEFRFSAMAGNYKLKSLIALDTSFGIWQAHVDGVLRHQVDAYNASSALNWLVTSATFALTGDGWHTLRYTTIGKTAASTSNRVALSDALMEWQS